VTRGRPAGTTVAVKRVLPPRSGPSADDDNFALPASALDIALKDKDPGTSSLHSSGTGATATLLLVRQQPVVEPVIEDYPQPVGPGGDFVLQTQGVLSQIRKNNSKTSMSQGGELHSFCLQNILSLQAVCVLQLLLSPLGCMHPGSSRMTVLGTFTTRYISTQKYSIIYYVQGTPNHSGTDLLSPAARYGFMCLMSTNFVPCQTICMYVYNQRSYMTFLNSL
jgi:hypothetical protein